MKKKSHNSQIHKAISISNHPWKKIYFNSKPLKINELLEMEGVLRPLGENKRWSKGHSTHSCYATYDPFTKSEPFQNIWETLPSINNQ